MVEKCGSRTTKIAKELLLTTCNVRTYTELLTQTCNSVTDPFGYTFSENAPAKDYILPSQTGKTMQKLLNNRL